LEEEAKERKKPTDLQVGGSFLIFISIMNIIFGTWGIINESSAFDSENIFFGVMFLGLGIGSIKNFIIEKMT